MNKKLLTIAVAAAVMPLAAQAASPELYGRLGTELSRTTSSNTAWNLGTQKSWLGVRGESALYNDNMKLIYQVERGIDITENTDSDLTARNSYIGLAGDNWGKVFFGQYDGIIKRAAGKFDVFNNTMGDMDSHIAGQSRYKNTINYQTPDFGGLVVNAQIMPGENALDNDSDKQDGVADGYGASVSFVQETFWANLAYQAKSPTTALTSYTNYDIIRATGGITIGNIGFSALYQQSEATDVGGADTYSDWGLSGSLAATDRISLLAEYLNSESQSGNDSGGDKIATLGVNYELGKNVNTYFIAQQTNFDASGQDDRTSMGVGLSYMF